MTQFPPWHPVLILYRVKSEKHKSLRAPKPLTVWLLQTGTHTHSVTHALWHRGPVTVSNQSSVERQRRHIPASIYQHHRLTHLFTLGLQERRGEVRGGDVKMETRSREKTVCVSLIMLTCLLCPLTALSSSCLSSSHQGCGARCKRISFLLPFEASFLISRQLLEVTVRSTCLLDALTNHCPGGIERNGEMINEKAPLCLFFIF